MQSTYTRIIPTRWGNMVAMECDNYITPSLMFYGDSTIDEVSIALSLVKPGDVVVDAGANIGTFTLPLAQKIGPTGTLYAVEPQRFAHQCLTANIIINSLSEWTHPIRSALGDNNDDVDVMVIDPRKPNNMGGARVDDLKNLSGLNVVGFEKVPKITLDSIGLKRMDLLKVDCEGMDLEVLKGGLDTIIKCLPAIMCELLPEDGDKAGEEMRNFFELAGYHAVRVGTRLYSHNNARRNQENVFGDITSYNVIGLPKSVEFPEMLATLPGL